MAWKPMRWPAEWPRTGTVTGAQGPPRRQADSDCSTRDLAGDEPTRRSAPRPHAVGSDDSEERLVLTVGEAAKILGISKSFAYELCATGELPALRLGRRVVVPRRALVEFVEGACAEPARSSSILSLNVRPQSSAAAASATGRTLA